MRTRRVGRHALLVLVDDPAAALAARALVLELAGPSADDPLPAPGDVVPAARTVLVDGLADSGAVEQWRTRLHGLALPARSLRDSVTSGRDEVRIDVVYDGADLGVVADRWGCSPEAVVARHQETRYVVAFCGFAPGFAYCAPMSPLPTTPRRSAPRERVPAGSVGLAGEYCGVYPRAMPGGWQLIGVTRADVFDPDRPEPALLMPGDAVRFRAAP